jgi:hypothetical protein
MAFKGARSDPVQGIKGSKPRLRRPKLPRRPETAESAELGEEYLRKRNALLDLKYKREAMLLARDRDQLIERELVQHQLAYLMIPLRQKILGIPFKLGNRFGNREVPVREVADFCRTLVHEALTEVSNLPLTVSDPHWLEKAEDWMETSEGKGASL